MQEKRTLFLHVIRAGEKAFLPGCRADHPCTADAIRGKKVPAELSSPAAVRPEGGRRQAAADGKFTPPPSAHCVRSHLFPLLSLCDIFPGRGKSVPKG